jgi:hypothetical protein
MVSLGLLIENVEFGENFEVFGLVSSAKALRTWSYNSCKSASPGGERWVEEAIVGIADDGDDDGRQR